MKYKCNDCDTVFDGSMEACPNCGCPVEDAQENNQADSDDVYTESAFIHDNFNEKEPYSPFKSDSWFFRDPWPMYYYPKGALYQKYPLIDWLLGPWYLTCKDKKEQEEYDVINNIFYFLNLIFKIVAYSIIWWVFKIWWLILLGLFLLVLLIRIVYALGIGNINFLMAPIFLMAALIFGIIVGACAMGKALHRYWPQLHKTFRRLNKRYWDAMLDKK